MTHPKTPEAIRAKLQKQLRRLARTLLLNDLFGVPFEAMSFSIEFDRQAALEDISAYERFEESWREGVRDFSAFQVALCSRTARWTFAGGSREILHRVVFFTLEGATAFAFGSDGGARLARAKARLSTLLHPDAALTAASLSSASFAPPAVSSSGAAFALPTATSSIDSTAFSEVSPQGSTTASPAKDRGVSSGLAALPSLIASVPKSRAFIERLIREKALLESESDTEFRQLIELVDYLLAHRSLNCYVREIPVLGVDTKFLETYIKPVCDLLSVELEEPVDKETLFARWKIQTPPFMVKLRHAQTFIAGIPETLLVSLPLEALQRKPKALVIVENLQTGLALAGVPRDIPVVTGMGFGAVRLSELAWIRDVPILYFGDLDAHGFAILSAFRKVAPQTVSVLMNRDVFQAFEALSVQDPTQNLNGCESIALTEEEAELFEILRRDRRRLEQERIPLKTIEAAFEKRFAAGF